jgi:hypothetical protein
LLDNYRIKNKIATPAFPELTNSVSPPETICDVGDSEEDPRDAARRFASQADEAKGMASALVKTLRWIRNYLAINAIAGGY